MNNFQPLLPHLLSSPPRLGVNLPAHRVIIKGMKLGADPMPVSTFRQMCGRAGRLGLDDAGEAILMIRNTPEVCNDPLFTRA